MLRYSDALFRVVLYFAAAMFHISQTISAVRFHSCSNELILYYNIGSRQDNLSSKECKIGIHSAGQCKPHENVISESEALWSAPLLLVQNNTNDDIVLSLWSKLTAL